MSYERAAVYVAYRRPDAAAVRQLLDALHSCLGPPPAWCDRWFFLDTSDLASGETWLHSLTEAHRSAACILGVLSDKTMPRTGEEFARHAIYIDELILGQSSGRLQPVTLGTTPLTLPLGLNVTQSLMWQDGADTIPVLAGAIRRQADSWAPVEMDHTRDRRERWLGKRRRTISEDQMVPLACTDMPLMLRHVFVESHEKAFFVSARPLSVEGETALNLDTVQRIQKEAYERNLKLRLLWADELADIVAAPPDAPTSWRNPYDLAVDLDGPALWAMIDVRRPPVLLSPYGDVVEGGTTAALWLALANFD